MFGPLARLSGFLALAAGLVIGTIDGARSIADQTIELASIGDLLAIMMPGQILLLKVYVSQMLHPLLWDPVMVNLLRLPLTALFFSTGLLLLVLGRRTLTPIIAPQ